MKTLDMATTVNMPIADLNWKGTVLNTGLKNDARFLLSIDEARSGSHAARCVKLYDLELD
jgi:hypothetical protein